MTSELMIRLWARRSIIAKRGTVSLVGCWLMIAPLFMDKSIPVTIGAMIIGGAVAAAGSFSLIADWKTHFHPRFWWDDHARLNGTTLTVEKVQSLCQRKRIAHFIDEDFGPGTGLGFRVGFITESDQMIVMMSL